MLANTGIDPILINSKKTEIKDAMNTYKKDDQFTFRNRKNLGFEVNQAVILN